MKKIIFFALSCFLISPFANAQAPANDDCVNAEALSCNSSATGSTVNATNPANLLGPDIWYSITGNGGDIEMTLADILLDQIINDTSCPEDSIKQAIDFQGDLEF